jgi:hypothetical protein
MNFPELLTSIDPAQVALACASFGVGYFVRSYTLSAKERSDVNQVAFVNAKELASLQNQRFNELMETFAEYAGASDKPTVKEFAALNRVAQDYLYQQQLTADAILSGKVDKVTRDNTLMPKLVETAERIIPKVYATLHDIADQNGIDYPIDFKRENYESIYSAVEKYGRLDRRNPVAPVASPPP